jgi:hypothetical protein
MKNRSGVFALLLMLKAASLFGSARAEEKEILNGEWTLCISAFDASSLPPERRIVADVIMRSLAAELGSVEHRTRESSEQDWYTGYAHNQAKIAAAQALAAKREERDILLYKGDPGWRYRRDIKSIDREIEKLEEELREIEDRVPLIAAEPVFVLSEDNKSGKFLPPPQPGMEYSFCREQKADAFLAGSVTEYYNRIYLTLRLYAVDREWIYEDSIIFSSDDFNKASDEIARRLVAAVSGSEPAFIAVHAKPSDAVISFNNSLAGRGEAPAQERTPGKLTLVVSAENYRSETVETELKAGVKTDISVSLMPLDLSMVRITVPEKLGTLVYRGAYYEGEAPLSLSFPSDGLEYLFVETPGGETGALVLTGSALADLKEDITFTTSMPPRPGTHSVEDERKRYYGAWGRLWIALPTAFLINGIADAHIEGWNSHVANSGGAAEANLLYDNALSYRNLRWGAWAVAGAALTDVIFSVYRYIKAANKDTVRVIK